MFLWSWSFHTLRIRSVLLQKENYNLFQMMGVFLEIKILLPQREENI